MVGSEVHDDRLYYRPPSGVYTTRQIKGRQLQELLWVLIMYLAHYTHKLLHCQL